MDASIGEERKDKFQVKTVPNPRGQPIPPNTPNRLRLALVQPTKSLGYSHFMIWHEGG